MGNQHAKSVVRRAGSARAADERLLFCPGMEAT